jgi:hypothetical protein
MLMRIFLFFGVLLSLAQAQKVAYVQGNYATPQTPQSTVSVPFTSPQLAGNLNVIVVGWQDNIAVVNSVKDTSGNTYTRAVGPTIGAGVAQSIYYGKIIKVANPGPNIVTVTFSPAAVNPDIRIVEYSGTDPTNPVDRVTARKGNSALSASGSVITTTANDLLFGANMVATYTIAPGPGFTNRMVTSPDGDIVEDRIAKLAGSHNATAALGSSGPWVMQMVAIRAAPLHSAVLSWQATSVVAGYNVYRGTISGGPYAKLNSSLIASTSNTDTTIQGGRTYYYVVTAVDSSLVESAYSNQAIAVVP